MKYNLKTTFFFTTTILLLLPSLSSVSYAAPQLGSCPAGHLHGGHDRTQYAEMGKKASGIQTVENLADDECSNCHGLKGVSVSDDVPNLAGQQFMYLCAWLDGCRTQGEKCEGHEDIAAKLSDQEIVDLSEFYARLHSNNR